MFSLTQKDRKMIFFKLMLPDRNLTRHNLTKSKVA